MYKTVSLRPATKTMTLYSEILYLTAYSTSMHDVHYVRRLLPDGGPGEIMLV